MKNFISIFILVVLSVGVGYVSGGYLENYNNYQDRTSVEIGVSFIRLSIALDSLKALKDGDDSRAVEIQEGVACAIERNISMYDLSSYLAVEFNRNIAKGFESYKTEYKACGE